MKLTIYRGTKEIGGTLIEAKTGTTRILIDVGYPLFLKNQPIDDEIARLPYIKLLELGVLPAINGLYVGDIADFNAVIISHAHLDHYGLLKYINPKIPVYMSKGTKKLIQISQAFKITDPFILHIEMFKMYEPFSLGDFTIKPYLVDHSAFDASAFEITAENKTVLYTGDFRGHGRKSVCLERLIKGAKKQLDLLLTEGTMLSRQEEDVITEDKIQELIENEILQYDSPVLFQSSSQNIDRLVSFYKAAMKRGRTFVIDIYTANILYELHQLGNKLPYPSIDYPNIKVFYPRRLTEKVFKDVGEEYAKRFSSFHISREQLTRAKEHIVMMVRPSMQKDIERCNFHNGLFIYSMWAGYRSSEYQQNFEQYLHSLGFALKAIHTSGHAAVCDIRQVIEGLNPKRIIPVHTMEPDTFKEFFVKTELHSDGEEFEI